VRRLAALLCLLSGCSFSVEHGGAADAGPNPPVPDAAPGTPDAPDVPVPDAAPGTPDGGVVVAACGTPDVLTDDFADGVMADAWGGGWSWADSGTTLAETGGRLRITLAAGVSGDRYAGYGTAQSYDLRGSRASVTLVTPPNPNTGADAMFFARAAGGVAGNDRLEIVLEGGILYFSQRLNGQYVYLADVPFDPATHRHWRLRELAGTVFFETSPDRTAWTAHAQTATPAWAGQARFILSAGTWQSESAPGMVEFDDYNGGVPTGTRWCKAHTLTDDFDDGVLATAWSGSYTGSGCARAETGGRALLTVNAGSTSWCGYGTTNGYDLTGDAVMVTLAQAPPASSNTLAYFKLIPPYGDNALQIEVSWGTIKAVKNVNGSWSGVGQEVPYDAVAHKVLRMREQGGTVYFEASPDGAAWTQIAQLAAPFAVDALMLELGAGQDSTSPAETQVAWDRFNLAP
jgi:hypothetical protein